MPLPPESPITALDAAVSQNDLPAITSLLAASAPITPMTIACALTTGSPSLFALLFAHGLDPNTDLERSGSPLIGAVSTSNIPLTSFLLARGADPNIHLQNNTYTPLAVATRAGSVEIVRMLLSAGATVRGSGALIVAAEEGEEGIVQILLEGGADMGEVGLRDWSERRTWREVGTALHKAVAGGHRGVLVLLLKEGADVAAVDGKGRTVVEVAEEVGDEGVMQLLRDAEGPGKAML